ncbi:MAG: glycoside hydrolase family 9 protein [Planctomycetota bacterium]
MSTGAIVAAPADPPIRLGQVGFLPGETKVVVVDAAQVGDAESAVVFQLVPGGDNEREVATVPLGEAVESPDTGEVIQHVDLTDLNEPGRYAMVVGDHRVAFAIAADAYDRPLRMAIRSFTGQRHGIAVSLAPDFPQFAHGGTTSTPLVIHGLADESRTIPSVRGWHDAGDFGRYVVNSGITMGTLLWTWELHRPTLEPMQLDLPPGDEHLPDYLREIKWNLDWILSMQEEDGGAWHKATKTRFAGKWMPDDPREARATVYAIGREAKPGEPRTVTTATANLAAVAAIAARVYREYDPAYANRCLDAARRAFAWCVEHPDATFLQNPPGIHTGEYKDADPTDEMLWAAAELFRTTGEATYEQYFKRHHERYNLASAGAPYWGKVSVLALLAYAMIDDGNGDPALLERIRKDAATNARRIVDRIEGNPYRMPLSSNEYFWGSNGIVANYGLILAVADHLEPSPRYRQGVLDCLHYLLGRNTFAMSFMTGVGHRSVQNIHHRPSMADGVDASWPGLLAGGPNAGGKTPPARQWVDDASNYRVNENAINWNAPLVLILTTAATIDEELAGS